MENKRKLVKQGAATLMISLPSKWIKQNGLDKGDEVSVEEEGNDLVISQSQSAKKEQKASIDVSDYSPLINVVLIHLYIKGIDELEIKFSNPNIIKKFQKSTINQLMGFEIIQQSSNRMLVRDITGSGNQDIDDLIKRIFFIINSMIEEYIEAVEKKDVLDPIIEIDLSINKFVNYTLRTLNKRGYKETHKAPQIYGIVSILEQIGDIFKSIANESKKTKPDKVQLEIIKDIQKQLSLFKDLLSDFEKEKEIKFAKSYEHIKSKIKRKNHLDYLLIQLNDSIIRLNNYLLVISLL